MTNKDSGLDSMIKSFNKSLKTIEENAKTQFGILEKLKKGLTTEQKKEYEEAVKKMTKEMPAVNIDALNKVTK